MTAVGCAELHELAPELALGTLPGDDRAGALLHLEHCGECQLLVEELSSTADALLLAAPEADPSAGFEERTVAGFGVHRRRGRWRAVAAVAAAGALAVVGAVATTTGLANHDRPAPRFALGAAGVRMARFVAAPGERIQGQVFSYADDSSWLFMTVTDDGSSDTYVCQVELLDGRTVDIGSFQLRHGAGSWGRTLAEDPRQIKTVRLVDGAGHRAASASLT